MTGIVTKEDEEVTCVNCRKRIDRAKLGTFAPVVIRPVKRINVAKEHVRVESARKEYGCDESSREGFPWLLWWDFQRDILWPLTGKGDLRRIEWRYLP